MHAALDPDHRSTAARYLGQLNAVAAIPELIRLLDADQQDVRTPQPHMAPTPWTGEPTAKTRQNATDA